MERHPMKSHSSKPDPVMAALTVVCQLISGRNMGPEEIAYIRGRVESYPRDVLAATLERLADRADRIGNPLAAIHDGCRAILKDRAERGVADELHRQIEESRKRRATNQT